MNNKIRIMIHCLIAEEKGLSNELLKSITALVQRKWPNMKVVIKTDIDYWKWKNCREVIYSISYPQPISVSDFIKLFKDISWYYSKDSVTDFETHDKYNSESATWNIETYPTELFLVSGVRWVNVYTWPN